MLVLVVIVLMLIVAVLMLDCIGGHSLGLGRDTADAHHPGLDCDMLVPIVYPSS